MQKGSAIWIPPITRPLAPHWLRRVCRFTAVIAICGAPLDTIAKPAQSAEEEQYQALLQQFSRHDLDPKVMKKTVRSYLRRYGDSKRAEVLKKYLARADSLVAQARKDVIGTWAWYDTDRLAYAFNTDGSCVFFTRGTRMAQFEAPDVNIHGLEGCWQDSEKIFVTQPSMRTTVNAIINTQDELELTVHCQHFDDGRPSRLGPLEGLLTDSTRILSRDGWVGARPAHTLLDGLLLHKVSNAANTTRTCRNKDDEEKEKWLEAESLW